MMRLLVLTLMVVLAGVVSVGCGRQGEPTVEADLPVWVEDDVRAHLRDYLISVAEDGPRQEILLLFIVAGAPDFQAVYKSDGWWEVSGGDLGRASWPAGPTPTPGPTPEPVRIIPPSEGVWLVSERTQSVMPQNDAAGLLHWCLIADKSWLKSLC